MGEADTNIKQRAEERIGSVLREKWCLDQLLGIGGMAAVYAATHRNGKRAAIKMLHPEAALIPDVRARFLREGYLANKVGHIGAVSILDDDVDDDGHVYLVMELLEGETLEDRWRREDRLPWADVLLVADQILDVLITAHAKHIVHRDLKPGNLFIHADGTIKILDFGIARLGTLQPGINDTGPHVSLGTPGFMPPEQARGRSADIDAQSDLWSVGATMYALVTGRHVHEAETANEQLLKAMTEPAQPVAEVAPEVPSAVATIIDCALSYDKTNRWSDARAMQAAVRDAYEALVGQPIAKASGLALPAIRVSRSVHPDAPTLAADAPLDDRLTTTRPVSDKKVVEGSPSRARPAWMAAVLAGAIAAAVAIGVLLSQNDEATHAAASTPSESPAAAAVPEPGASAEHEQPPPQIASTPEPVEPPPAPSATSAPAPLTKPRLPKATRPPTPKTAASAGAESGAGTPEVDIFSRRN